MFKSVGTLNPHLYHPNEIFASNWIYEGLVRYGRGGSLEPALAVSWTTPVPTSTGGQRVVFTLRDGVKFHDGSEWNCTVAKLNFDHVLSVEVKERHLWYGLPQHISSWSCDPQGKFVIETLKPYYPLIQELAYIRPLAMAAATAFAEGLGSSAETHNSCTIGGFGPARFDYLYDSVSCVGLSAPIGTGPFKFHSRQFDTMDNTTDKRVLFEKNEDYWGAVPGFDYLEVKHYESTAAVEEALLRGQLDMALGIGPLSAQQVYNFKIRHHDMFETIYSDVVQNAVVVLNTGRAPTNDITVRKTIMHAVNKAFIVDKEFQGISQPVSQLFPKSVPYCDMDLTPRWDYDLEKAILLNCPATISSLAGGLSTAAIVVIAVVVALAVLLGLFAFVLIMKERKGEPMFMEPLMKTSGAVEMGSTIEEDGQPTPAQQQEPAQV